MDKVNLDIAVEKILASPAPVLILDTCTLLDLIRIPYRSTSEQEANQTIVSALELANAFLDKEPPQLWVIVLQTVYDEWHDNIQSTIDELVSHLRKLDNNIKITNTIATALGIEFPEIMYQDSNIEQLLRTVPTYYLQHGLFLLPNENCERKAYSRAIRNEAPARKGGQLKDCTIVEHALELCKQLRSHGLILKCIFMTSNRKDFCEHQSDILKAPLYNQFNEVGLVLTTRWNWTRTEYET